MTPKSDGAVDQRRPVYAYQKKDQLSKVKRLSEKANMEKEQQKKQATKAA